MRFLGIPCLLIVATVGAQQSPVAKSLFSTVKPDITVVVKPHQTGANMVEITMLNPNYPPELLKERILQLGRNLGAETRGVVTGKYPLSGNDPKMEFVKGSFSINGLMDTTNGTIRIQSILKAFVGDPEPWQIRGFSLLFVGVHPNERTVKSFQTKALNSEARVLISPNSAIEYRIVVLTANPDLIEFPDRLPERKTLPIPSESDSGLPIMGWVGIGATALGAGALVYLSLLKPGNKRLKS
jgi:hypothetical protein